MQSAAASIVTEAAKNWRALGVFSIDVDAGFTLTVQTSRSNA